jgi:hypothetical protein
LKSSTRVTLIISALTSANKKAATANFQDIKSPKNISQKEVSIIA